jgi:hypothetical protein
MSLADCISRYPVHDPLPVIWISASAGIGLQHRRACLFHLKKQAIIFASRHQCHDAPGADAADTDHLERDIRKIETVEQRTAVIRQ